MNIPEMGLPATWDIESVGWTHPIAVGFFDGRAYHEFIQKTEDQDVIWEFLCYLRENFQGLKLFAHCASKFDNKFILASLCQHGEIVQMEGGLIRLKWKAVNISFEDSYLIVPMSLERANKTFGSSEKGHWEHGPVPWEMGDSLSTFKEYLKNDCLSLAETMFHLCELLGSNFGQMPSISLSTTAAKIFSKCFYDIDTIEANEKFELFIRTATYGGRNEVYKRYGENINMYDIKSMFVSCYDQPVPVGALRWIKPNIDKGTIAEARVKVPKDWYIGPLPFKLNGRLTFPVGEFASWWDIVELRNAVKLGADVTITKQIETEELPVMKDFGAFVAKIRGGKEDAFWKLFGLSLCGKLGQSRWRDKVQHISEIKDLKGYTPLDKDEQYFVCKEYTEKGPYIRPALAMRIRALSRIKHLDLLLDAKSRGEIFYGDTDSVFTTSTMKTGTTVGELISEGQASRGYFIRQKLYAFVEKGRLKQRSAGFSDLKLKEEDFKAILNGRTIDIDFDFLPSFRKVLQDKEFKLIEKERRIKSELLVENRIPDGLETRPICLPLPHKS